MFSYVPDHFFNAELPLEHLTVDCLNSHECVVDLNRDIYTGVTIVP
jgi:hypothetical protein